MIELCSIIFINKYYKSNQRNYLKIKLAAEIILKLSKAVNDYFNKNDENNSFLPKIIKSLSSLDSKIAVVIRYFLLSLIQQKQNILEDPFFKGKEKKMKTLFHKLGIEFLNKKLTENNIKTYRKWILSKIKEESMFKMIDDVSKQKIGKYFNFIII